MKHSVKASLLASMLAVGLGATALAADKVELTTTPQEVQKTVRQYLDGAQVTKVERSGVFGQQVSLEYSQERLAAYGFEPSNPQKAGGENVLPLLQPSPPPDRARIDLGPANLAYMPVR